MRRELRKARKALRRKQPDYSLARASLEKAITVYENELRWRSRAYKSLLPDLEMYNKTIAGTIGVRGQSRLPENIALKVAKCSAIPRDIYLNF
jgi:hypothetical protein